MNQVLMQLPLKPETAYPILIDSGLLEHPAHWLPNGSHSAPLVIITDETVKCHYGDRLLQALDHHNPLLLSIPEGEPSKNHQIKHDLEEQMILHQCDRDTVILSLGGGVVGDMAGFVAATFMRGIAYIQLPTTLLAMVDSSVGGKTAINSPQGKNLIGAFWQPNRVVIDIDCLSTLPETHIINGLIEVVKMILIHDHDAFQDISGMIDGVLNRDPSTLKNIIQRAVTIKASIVGQDEKENHLRKILNYGHTIGHALEKVTNYSLLHGYAVGLGILVESKISQLSGILSEEDYVTIRSIFARLTILGQQLKKYNIDDILQATKSDKKNRGGKVRYVLLKKPGVIFHEQCDTLFPVPDETVREALHLISEEQHGRQ